MPNLELRNATQLHQKATATYDEAVKERDRLENPRKKAPLIKYVAASSKSFEDFYSS